MVRVRKAEISDAKRIVEITSEAFLQYIKAAGIKDTPALHENEEQVIEDIKNKDVYVAVVEDEIVGSVRIHKLDEDTVYLSRFGVSMEHRNLGIGKLLMNYLDAVLMQKKVKHIVLHTASKATHLIKFYYNRGFYVDEVSKDKGYIRALLKKDLMY